MRLNIWWIGSAALGRLDRIEQQLGTVIENQQQQDRTMSEMDDKIAKLRTDIAAERTVIDSAILYAKSVPTLIADAVAKATAAGATPEQLQAITDLQTASETAASDLAAAIPQNTAAVAG